MSEEILVLEIKEETRDEEYGSNDRRKNDQRRVNSESGAFGVAVWRHRAVFRSLSVNDADIRTTRLVADSNGACGKVPVRPIVAQPIRPCRPPFPAQARNGAKGDSGKLIR